MPNVKIATNEGVVERKVAEGERLIDVLLSAGIYINSDCGGMGTCGKCLAEVECEEKAERVLACRYRINSDIAVRVLGSERRASIVTEFSDSEAA